MLRALLLRHFSHAREATLFRKVPENTAHHVAASRAGFIPRSRLTCLPRIEVFRDPPAHFLKLFRIFLDLQPQTCARKASNNFSGPSRLTCDGPNTLPVRPGAKSTSESKS